MARACLLCLFVLIFILPFWALAGEHYLVAEGSAPTMTSWGNKRLDVFVRGEGNIGKDNLLHRYWNGRNWSPWKNLGGILSAAPSCVSWGPNRIDCFVRGPKNRMWQVYWNGRNWSKWKDHGGYLTSAPSVSSRKPNHLDIFIRGHNNQLFHQYWNGHKWSPWKNLGGTLSSAPSCTSWGPKRVDCFVRGKSNRMWQIYWNGRNWSKWKDHGGVLASGPTVSSRGVNRLDIFVRGKSHRLQAKYWNGSWSKWRDLGGILTAAPASVSWGQKRIDLVVRGRSGCLWHRHWDGRWSQWKGFLRDCKCGEALMSLPFDDDKNWTVGKGNWDDNPGHNAGDLNGSQAYAIDFNHPIGGKIRAARAGRVVFVENHAGNNLDTQAPNYDPKAVGYGTAILIRHVDNTVAAYDHLKFQSTKVTLGQQVETGQVIALSGHTGSSWAPHLHFDLRAFWNSANDLGTTIRPRFRDKNYVCWVPRVGDTLASNNQ